ncbi:MAG: sigma-70 family RNA polymerase sigma factor [Pseudomonadota bacterium]
MLDPAPALQLYGAASQNRRSDLRLGERVVSLDGQDQQALLRAVADTQDRDAFATLFDYFAPRLKAFLLRQGADGGLAEEVVQETMLTVWRRAQTFDPAQAGVATWVFTIARNKRIDRLRRDNKPALDPHEPLLQPENTQVEQVIERQQQAARLQRAIAELPPEQGALVRMAYFGDKVHTTIAEETGIALGTVKSRLRLAMKRLRRSLEEDA